MQPLTAMSNATAALFWFMLTVAIAGSRLHFAAADSVPATNDDVDRREMQSSVPSSTAMVARLRAAVQRIQTLAEEVDAVLGLVEEDMAKDEILTAAAAAVGPSGSGSDMLKQLINEKRSKVNGAAVGLTKTGRRYDSFGVAGRFGRSADPQKKSQ